MQTSAPPIPNKSASMAGALLTAQELARHLGVSVSQVQRLSAQGKIPRYELGHRTIRFDLAEVRAALAASGAPSSAPPPPAPLPARSRRSPPTPPPTRDLPPYDWHRR